MKNAALYIEDKLEEFRIAGKSPAWLGLSLEVHKQLSEELKQKLREEDRDKAGPLTDFLGLSIIPMGGKLLPSDGVYIHDKRVNLQDLLFDKERL